MDNHLMSHDAPKGQKILSASKDQQSVEDPKNWKYPDVHKEKTAKKAASSCIHDL